MKTKTKTNTKMRGRKRKQRTTTEAVPDADAAMDFTKFPTAQPQPHTAASFRDRLKEFLSTNAVPTASETMTWQVPLRHFLSDGSPVAVPLFIVEEDVTVSDGSVYCDHCRVIGQSLSVSLSIIKKKN